jgi:hypothetical protein
LDGVKELKSLKTILTKVFVMVLQQITLTLNGVKNTPFMLNDVKGREMVRNKKIIQLRKKVKLF